MNESLANTHVLAGKLAEIARQYASQLDDSLAELARWVGGLTPNLTLEERGELRSRLHKLAGSSGTFGFHALSQRARELELDVALWVEQGGTVAPEIWKHWQASITALASLIQPLSERHADLHPTRTAPPPPKTRERLWIVHEDHDHASQWAQGLRQFGYNVVSVGTPQSLPHEGEAPPPDLLLVAMSDDSVRQGPLWRWCMQQQQVWGWHVPTIFIGARDDDRLKLAAVRMGADVFVSEPLDVPTLAGRIDRLLREVRQPPLRILVLDDDELLAEHYRLTLIAAGMLAQRQSQTETVMSTLRTFRPDLVLMDLYMPHCSGDELARIIRYDETWESLPIIFLSGETDLDKQKSALGSGADDFLVKPMSDVHLVATVQARARRARKLAELANQDSLTGLLRHASIKDRLNLEVERALRQGDLLSVAMVDIDHFKRVNDNWGHLVGDQVIRTLGHLLRQRLRGQDSVGRYGGEEFLIVLPQCAAHAAAELLDEIRAGFAEIRFRGGERDFSGSFSAGVSALGEGFTAGDLIGAADAALYRAKNGGRNQVCLSIAKEQET